MREFIRDWKEWGARVAIGNWLIGFTKWFIQAKRIQVTYGRQVFKKTSRKTVSK